MKHYSQWILLIVLAIGALQSAHCQEVNVALSSNGATIQADSEYLMEGGEKAKAIHLIQGSKKRWRPQPIVSHPHWAWIRFERPAKISSVTLRHSGDGTPVDFAGQTILQDGQTLKTLFRKVDAEIDAEHPSVTFEFPPVVTDNFRLLITRSSYDANPNETRLSDIEVFGEWADKLSTQKKPKPEQKSSVTQSRKQISDGPVPEGLKVVIDENEVSFVSPWLKMSFDLNRPLIGWFSLDGSGDGNHSKNLLLSADACVKTWNAEISSRDTPCSVSLSGNTIRYTAMKLGTLETMNWAFTIQPKSVKVSLDRHVYADYLTMGSSPLRMLWDSRTTLATPMGRLISPGELASPLLFHFPDYGTLLVRSKGSNPTWKFKGWRRKPKVLMFLQNGVKATPDAMMLQKSGKHHVELDMALTSIYPEKKLVDADPELAGVKRGWLNAFGFRPDVASLSNNSVSTSAIFCMYQFADQAYYTPPLFDDFTALDMVRMSLDAYFDGVASYGRDNAYHVDTDPAIVISAWDYATGKPDMDWLRRRIDDIEYHADHILAADINGDGLVEATHNGISGKGPKGGGGGRSNWWDQISFGWNDAYGNALDYRALRCAADLEDRLGRSEKAEAYRKQAARTKAVYYETFYNPKTGVLAGWRSKDGELHDYYFTFVNGIAIAYGLVTPEQGNAIMDRMQAKMREVGYTYYRLGLPGNLVPIPRKDYFNNNGNGAPGQSVNEDGSDGFQIFENGGATACYAHFYIQALYTLGRKEEADHIFDAVLEGYRDGVFQDGRGSNAEWRKWDGTPSGIEGLLTDAYCTLSVLITGRLGKGVPIP